MEAFWVAPSSDQQCRRWSRFRPTAENVTHEGCDIEPTRTSQTIRAELVLEYQVPIAQAAELLAGQNATLLALPRARRRRPRPR